MNVNEVYAPIAALDLSTVCTRLMHPHAGPGWSKARTLAAESDYREFLLFAKMNPAETPSPTADVDVFWHFHILDTLKYARDCAGAFGYFVHHKPDVEFDDEQILETSDAAPADGRADDSVRAGAWCALTTKSAAWCAVAAKPQAWCALTGSTAHSRSAVAQPSACARYAPDLAKAGRSRQAHYA